MCLYCDDSSKQFESGNAVHKHMEGKSHYKLHYGDDRAVEEEIAEFYDFSSRYDCTHCCVTFNCCCGDFSATSSRFFLVALADILQPSSHQWCA